MKNHEVGHSNPTQDNLEITDQTLNPTSESLDTPNEDQSSPNHVTEADQPSQPDRSSQPNRSPKPNRSSQPNRSPNPLKQLNVHKTPGVELFAEEEGIKPNSNNDELLNRYITDLSETISKLDRAGQERLSKVIKTVFCNEFCIAPNKIPRETLIKQAKRAFALAGQVGVELDPNDEQLEEQIQIESERIRNDQKESLSEWIDYLGRKNNNPYSLSIRYFTLLGVVGLGNLETKVNEETVERTLSFSRRMKEGATIAPFPEIRREALALLMSRLQAYYDPNGLKIDTNSPQQEQNQPLDQAGNQPPHSAAPHQTNNQPLEQEQNQPLDYDSNPVLDNLIKQKANFGKLYAEAIKQTTSDQEKQWEVTDGEWRKFTKGQEQEMYDSLEGQGSNLCIGSSISNAKSYTERGDMYIYYSRDPNGNYTTPRAAISVSAGKVTEVRGTYNSNEDLDPFIPTVVEKKLAELPEGDKYFKRIADVDQLTDINNRFSDNEPLTDTDLRFLYELDSPIENFGYSKDPRIAEILEGRNKRQDLSKILNCREDQISLTTEEVLSGDIVYHYGDLDLYNLTSAEGLTFPQSVGGYMNLYNLTSAEGLTLPQSVGGYMNLYNLTSAEGLTFPQSVGGNLNLGSLTSAEGLNLPQSVGGNLSLGSLTSAEGLKLPETISGSLHLDSLTSAEGLTLPQSISGSLHLDSLTSAEGLTLPQSISGGLYLASLTSAEGLDLSGVTIGGDLDLFNLISAEGLDLSGVTIGGYLYLSKLDPFEKEKLRLKYPHLNII